MSHSLSLPVQATVHFSWADITSGRGGQFWRRIHLPRAEDLGFELLHHYCHLAGFPTQSCGSRHRDQWSEGARTETGHSSGRGGRRGPPRDDLSGTGLSVGGWEPQELVRRANAAGIGGEGCGSFENVVPSRKYFVVMGEHPHFKGKVCV